MNEITNASILAALGRQMTIAVARRTTVASSFANVDTPGYRTHEAALGDVTHPKYDIDDYLLENNIDPNSRT